MVEAHHRDRWDHTSQLLCLIANCHRNPEKRGTAFQPWEFHPIEAANRSPTQDRISWGTFEKLLGLDDDEE